MAPTTPPASSRQAVLKFILILTCVLLPMTLMYISPSARKGAIPFGGKTGRN